MNAGRWQRAIPLALAGIWTIFLLRHLMLPATASPFDLNGFGKLPVLNGGRLKPLDTVARTSLLMLRGHQSVRVQGRTLSAQEWLADMMFRPAEANQYPVFEIDDPDVLGLMGIYQTTNRYYAFHDIESSLSKIQSQAGLADGVKPEQRTRFQNAILNLSSRIQLYQRLQNTVQVAGEENGVPQLQSWNTRLPQTSAAMADHTKNPGRLKKLLNTLGKDLARDQFLAQSAEFLPLPLPGSETDSNRWSSLGEGLMGSLRTGEIHPGIWSYAAMGDAYRARQAETFNQAVEDYTLFLTTHVPQPTSRSSDEVAFNHFEPFYQSMVIYVVVLLLAFFSWMIWPELLNRSAFALLVMGFTVHTIGLVSRMVLQGRPPVTNLYSSAIFVGWAAVLLGLILEKLYRNGIGSVVASVLGFITLIIAHHLMSQGDTMEMMRAVLDSNFWLATHVVCITIGYSSTFLSGTLATVYIFRRLFDKRWTLDSAETLERMVYGIICFSTFFSFLGTILGGIWADQSWGRFWGWDPKENGALMIVLWNVFILHARLGGYAKTRTVMVMAVFGNIVTACSWFGVNMLGIGLHSYGFMDKAFVWLMIFSASQLLVMGLGLLPKDFRKRLGLWLAQ